MENNKWLHVYMIDEWYDLLGERRERNGWRSLEALRRCVSTCFLSIVHACTGFDLCSYMPIPSAFPSGIPHTPMIVCLVDISTTIPPRLAFAR